jgi:hypothetical protein
VRHTRTHTFLAAADCCRRRRISHWAGEIEREARKEHKKSVHRRHASRGCGWSPAIGLASMTSQTSESAENGAITEGLPRPSERMRNGSAATIVTSPSSRFAFG